MEQKPTTNSIDQREVVISYLERERIIAMTATDGVERLAARTRIDNLLDELSSLATSEIVEVHDGRNEQTI